MLRLVLLAIILIPATLQAADLSTVCHNELLSSIRAKHPLSIVDIQSAEGFRAHNYQGAIAAGPDTARLDRIAMQLRSTKGKVVVVSATGGADAQKAAERLLRGGVVRSRIVVLEGGMEAAAKNVACDCCSAESAPL